MHKDKVFILFRILLLISLVVLFFPLAIIPLHAAGNTYYVRKDGNDANLGTTDNAGGAWLTIQKATSTMVAGDTTYVHTGTYNEYVYFANSGAADNLITLAAYTGETVTIDGTGLSIGYMWGLVSANDQSYLVVDGFTIVNAMDTNLAYGVLSGISSSNNTFKNLTIHDCYESGIYSSSDYTTVSNCNVYYTNQNYTGQEQISFSGVSHGEIKNCTVHDSISSNHNGKEGICIKDASDNITVHNNEVYNSSGYYTKIGIYIANEGGSSVSVYANKCHDLLNSGIAIATETGVGTNSASFYNNLLYGNILNGFEASNYTGTLAFTFINNTLYNNSSSFNYPEILLQPSPSYSNCLIENNILFSTVNDTYTVSASRTGVSIDHNLAYNSGGSWHTGNVMGTNPVTSNPQLVNPTSNLSIGSSSPAKDAGVSLSAPATDYAGTARPQGSGYDIGAYEYTIPATPTLPPTATPMPSPVSDFSTGVSGVNGLIPMFLIFAVIFGVILAFTRGQNVIIGLIAAVVVFYMVFAFLPGINQTINSIFGW